MDFPSGKKDNWHKQRMVTKQKFSKHKPTIVNKPINKTNSSRNAPTPVIDVANSSDDRFSRETISSASASTSIYDQEFNSDSDDGLDFEIASKAPIGEDFKFSSEKEWENIDNTLEKCEFGEFFTINWKLLKAGLNTIPFYRAMDMDSSLFTNEELKEMNSKAEMNEKIYYDLLKEHEDDLLKKQNENKPSSSSGSRKSSAIKKRQKSGKNSIDNNNQVKIDEKKNVDITLKTQQNNDNKKVENDDQLDDLLNMTTENLENTKLEDQAIDIDKNTKDNEVNLSVDEKKEEAIPVNPENNKNEDIQEWLDGILDE